MRGKVEGLEHPPQGLQVHLCVPSRLRPLDSCLGKYTVIFLFIIYFTFKNHILNSMCFVQVRDILGLGGSWRGMQLLPKPELGLGLVRGLC